MNDEEGSSLAVGRKRREKSDKLGRLATFDCLKNLKGSKNKYELNEEKPVYEMVDEKSYSKLVQERQEEDWIVDDGTGYVEDGREIFDDDDIDEKETQKGQKKSASSKVSYKAPQMTKKSSGKESGIKTFFGAVQPKKKIDRNLNLDDDKYLGDIIQQVTSCTSSTPKPTLLKKRVLPTPPLQKRKMNPFAKSPLSSIISETKTTNKNVPTSESQTWLKIENDSFKLDENPSGSAQDLNIEENDQFLVKRSKRKLPPGEDAFKVSPSTSKNENKQIKLDPGNEEVCIEEYNSEMQDFTNIKTEKIKTCSENFDDFIGDEDDFLLDVELNPTGDNIKISETEVKIQNFINEETKETKSLKFVTQWDETIVCKTKENIVDMSEIDATKLPIQLNENGENVVKFFWLDAHEDYFKHPGTVFLFGKIWMESVKCHVSCCIIVKDINRRVFLLPKGNTINSDENDKNVTMTDVYNEFNDIIAKKYDITEFKCKTSIKKYAFEKGDVPSESEYLEIRYSPKMQALPADLKGSTFSHIFGTNTSSLESLIIEKKIKGPLWLEIKAPELSNPPISWCNVEISIDDCNKISVIENQPDKPNIVMMCLSIQTAVNPSNHQNEIVSIASCFHNNFPLSDSAPSSHENYFCAISKPSNMIFPYDLKKKLANNKGLKVEKTDSERALLAFFLAYLNKIDPDIIVGHDLMGFYLDVLLHRLGANNVPNWSKVGRLRRTVFPKKSTGFRSNVEKTLLSGRLICDIKISAQELIRARSYDLPELVSQVLNKPHQTVDPDNIRTMYSSSDDILSLIRLNLLESTLILRIMSELNILPLASQITNIAGNLLGRTLLGGRSERNEFLLLHAFNEKNYICPDKMSRQSSHKSYLSNEFDEELEKDVPDVKSGKKKAAYAGGLVLEPKKGFYDNFVLLMDFNSLYPSIIQEYNICFTTVKRFQIQSDQESLALIPDDGQKIGILPNEIQKLVESRRKVKALMKAPKLSSELMLKYDIRQKALKLTANSMYGCLGFTNSRFYAKPLAALITSKGRDILLHTKNLVEMMSLEVIYGDTDSIMINTNSQNFDEVLVIGQKVQKEVNKIYRQLEIEVDGVYKSMLLLKKKKYAAIIVSKKPNGEMVMTKEIKGLDIIRRDWSDLAKKGGAFVIEEILSDKPKDEICKAVYEHLEKLGLDIQSGQIPLSDYVITKQLTKNPENYPDKNSLPHVQVALRINAKGGKRIKQGDVVAYVVCQDAGNQDSIVSRVYHPEEVKTNQSLLIDTKYYLQQQLLPVVSRLCQPIQGLEMAILADKLGLDKNAFSQAKSNVGNLSFYAEGVESALESTYNIEDRFEDCEPLIINCPNRDCAKQISIRETLIGTLKVECSFSNCPHCNTILGEYSSAIQNSLKLLMRNYITRFYQSWYICEEISCQYRTRKLPLRFSRSGPICPSCCKSTLYQEYNSTKLYNQLSYFRYIVDLRRAILKLKNENKSDFSEKAVKLLRSNSLIAFSGFLMKTVDSILAVNAYNKVDLSKLFEAFNKPNNQFSPFFQTTKQDC